MVSGDASMIRVTKPSMLTCRSRVSMTRYTLSSDARSSLSWFADAPYGSGRFRLASFLVNDRDVVRQK